RRISPDGIIRTIAGDGTAGFRGDGGPAEQSQLDTPYGLCLDSAGNLYIADYGNARIRKISPDGKISTVAGGGSVTPGGKDEGRPATEARFSTPRNVAVDGLGNLYISDFAGQRVYKVTSSGALTTVAGSGLAGYSGDGGPWADAKIAFPAGLTVDPQGALYIADTGNRTIRRVHQNTITTIGQNPAASGSPWGKFLSSTLPVDVPTGLASDFAGQLYITGGGANIVRLSPAGTFEELTAGGRDVALGPTGLVYLTTGRQVKCLFQNFPVTIAGSGERLFGGDGLPATMARLNTPIGLARDSLGNLLIVDSLNTRLRKLDTAGQLTTFAGRSESDEPEGDLLTSIYLKSPAGIAIDSRGTLCMAETDEHRIRCISAAGVVWIFAGTGEAGFRGDNGPAAEALLHSPTALAFDLSGNLYVADTGNERIRKIVPSGFISTVAGGGTAAGDGPALAAQLLQPAGVAVDRSGNIFFSESGSNRIRKVNAAGQITTLADAQAGLKQPQGLRVDEAGNLYFADTGNHQVRRISSSGKVTVIAGTGVYGFGGDNGPATAGLLSFPRDVALDPSGAIWISDSGNHRIRKLTPASGPDIVEPLPPGEVTLPPMKIVHAGMLREHAVAPGQIVTIYGQGLGPATGESGRLNAGRLETEVAQVQVHFDGVAAPLFYVREDQINVQVPFAISGRRETEITVMHAGAAKGRQKIAVSGSAPAFLIDDIRTGGAIALNQDGTVNSIENAAPRNSVVVLYATGDGQLGAGAIDGQPAEPVSFSVPVAVTVGGYPAEVLYAGRAPGLVGLMQLNIRIPGGFMPAGRLPVVMRLNGVETKNSATIVVR
ncbi:MAG: hypothetical protein ACRD7E_04285, partial [Bryobacteraceae bacterium]